MALQRNRKDATFDYALRLKDAGAIAASAAAQVGGVDKILDMGASRFDGRVIVDVTACEVDTGNEKYQIMIQGSTSSSFASGVWNLGALILGDSSVSLETVDTAATRHQEIAFCNEVNGVVYRYIRAYTFVAGTIASGGINYTANLVRET
jgi:hypothetical protein